MQEARHRQRSLILLQLLPAALWLRCRYVKAKHGYNEEWPLKTDDFFPYADNRHAYWTGTPGQQGAAA